MNRFQSLALVDRVARMEARIEDTLPSEPGQAAELDVATARETERKRLDELATELLGDTLALAAAIRTTDSSDAPVIPDPDRWIEPIVIYIDELVTDRLTSEGLMRWPLLQHEHYGFRDGGERFYDRLNDLLARGVSFDDLAPYLFCLHKGFRGQFVESQQDEIRSYVSRIRAAAPLIEDALTTREERPALQVRKPLSPLQMYGIAGACFVVFSALLVAWSNTVSL